MEKIIVTIALALAVLPGCRTMSSFEDEGSSAPPNQTTPPVQTEDPNPTDPVPPPTSSTCESISADIARQAPNIVTVSTVAQLQTAVKNAQANTTILIANGTYALTEGLSIGKPNVVLRSQSGDPTKVIIDTGYRALGSGVGAVTFRGPSDGSSIADVTIQRSIYHLIHLQDSDGTRIHRVILKNGGQQFLKSSPNIGTGQTTNDISVTCSRFVLDSEGRKNVWGYGAANGFTKCYTGGIDSHNSHRWTIRGNIFEGIYCDDTTPHPQHGQYASERTLAQYTGGLAEAAIHHWQGEDHVVAENQFINCARGIMFGLGNYSPAMATRGVIEDNKIYNSGTAKGASAEDVGIGIESVSQTRIARNTIWLTNYSRAIEYRFPSSANNVIESNSTNKSITARDNPGATTLQNNVISATSWY